MSLCPRTKGLGLSSIFLRPFIIRSLGIFSSWVMDERHFLTIFRGRFLGCYVDGRPLKLMHLSLVRKSSVYLFQSSFLISQYFSTCFVIKERPELKSKFRGHVQAIIEYASTIKDFDKLVDPRTLARHCLGSEPSHYILRAIRREEKNKLIQSKFVYKSFFLSLFV